MSLRPPHPPGAHPFAMSTAGLTFTPNADDSAQNDGGFGTHDMAIDCDPQERDKTGNTAGPNNDPDEAGRRNEGSATASPHVGLSSSQSPRDSAAFAAGVPYNDMIGAISDQPNHPPLHRRVVSDSVQRPADADVRQQPRRSGASGCSVDGITMAGADIGEDNAEAARAAYGASAQLFSWTEDGAGAAAGEAAHKQESGQMGGQGALPPALSALQDSTVNTLLGWRALAASAAGEEGGLDVFGGGDRAAAVAAALAAAAGISTMQGGAAETQLPGSSAAQAPASAGWGSHARSFSVDDVLMSREGQDAGVGAGPAAAGGAYGGMASGLPQSQSQSGRAPVSPTSLPPVSPRRLGAHSPRPSLSPGPTPSMSPGPPSASTSSQAHLSPENRLGQQQGAGRAGPDLRGIGARSFGSGGMSSSSMRRQRRSTEGLSVKDEVDEMDDEDAVRRVLASKKPSVELEGIDAKKAKRILANRLSAARSKERKTRHIIELEERVGHYEKQASALKATLAIVQRETTALAEANEAMTKKLQLLEQLYQQSELENKGLHDQVEVLRKAVGMGALQVAPLAVAVAPSSLLPGALEGAAGGGAQANAALQALLGQAVLPLLGLQAAVGGNQQQGQQQQLLMHQGLLAPQHGRQEQQGLGASLGQAEGGQPANSEVQQVAQLLQLLQGGRQEL